MKVTAELSQWLCGQAYDALPLIVREKTIDALYDSVGCMLACSALPEVKAIVEFVAELGGKPHCTIIGSGMKTSVVHAAMTHGAMAHGDECDPVHLASSGGHVAAGPVAAALAMGEFTNASGKEVIRAVALGYELGGRLMTIFYRNGDYLSRRFYPTSVVANASAAVAAGILLGLKPYELQVALGLAAYQAAGPDNMIKDRGHMGKTFQVAAAVRNGVTAALLAHRGCEVPSDILDSPLGLFDTYLARPDLGTDLLKDLGSYYAVTDVMHKRYPVGTPNQALVEGLLRILERDPVPVEEIASIEIQMHKAAALTLQNTRGASIAASAVAALVALDRKIDFYKLHDASAVGAPEVVQMQKKIHLIPREDWSVSEPGAINKDNRHVIVTIITKGGRKFEQEAWFQTMTRSELDAKFLDLVTVKIGAQPANELKELLQGIEGAVSVRRLMERLCVPASYGVAS